MEPLLPPDFEHRLSRHLVVEPPHPPPRRAAVAAILRAAAEGPEVLLMQRVEHERDPWSGHISLPGGTHDPEDPDLLFTALRETREEVGVDLEDAARLLCRLDPVTARAGQRIPEMDITPFVFRAHSTPTIQLGEEAADTFWLPLDQVVEGRFDSMVRRDRKGVRRSFPCWRYGERVVWGLTYYMVCELLRVGGAPMKDAR